MNNYKMARALVPGLMVMAVSGCALFNKPKDPLSAPEYSSDTLPPVLGVGSVQAEPGKRRLCSDSELARLFAGVDPAQAALLKSRVYLFATDASDLAPEAAASLDAHAAVLARGGAVAQLTGHTDERGTNDYNLALGERRANAVARYLVSHGVRSEQLAVVSLGKEKPVADGHDEAAWAQNRRVEVDYTECK